MGALKARLANYKRGVIGLPLSFFIGMDLRYQIDAHVVIATEQIPPSENVRQTVGRGTRTYAE